VALPASPEPRGPALTLEAAIAAALRLALSTDPEAVPLAQLAGRRLAEPVTARHDLPPFSNSAMDGYALRAADTPGTLAVTGESAAGGAGGDGPAGGEAWRISTGAAMPEGTDAVARQERVRVAGGRIEVASSVATGDDVRRAGEDLTRGATVLDEGHRIAPHEVALIGAAGHASARCRRPARLAIVTTGDELVPPGAPLRPGAVHDCNSEGIAAQARHAGAAVVAVRRVGDDRRATADALRALLDGDGETHPVEILVTVGGVSVGPHDHVRAALGEIGVEEVVPRVRARPGQPTWIGRRGAQAVLALPGNPVSAATCFHVFGRSLLGLPPRWDLRLPLADAVPAGRVPQLIRCRLLAGSLAPARRQGSGAISSMGGADALALLPAGEGTVPAGTLLDATLL
jgi:molybdopterin molybdotransferase